MVKKSWISNKYWQDFGGDPSDQSWNPTREEVKEWNKETDKLNKDIAKKKKRLVKGSNKYIKAMSTWKKMLNVQKKMVQKKMPNVHWEGTVRDPRNWKPVKQVLPTVGRQLLPYAKGLGWAGAITTGVSLFAQTKQGKNLIKKVQRYNIKTGPTQYDKDWSKGYSKDYMMKGPFNPLKGQFGERHYDKYSTGTKPQKIKHFPAQRKNN